MLITGGKVLLPNKDEPALLDIRSKNGKIVEIGESIQGDDEVIDADGCIVLPGAIDAHTHFDDPGYTHREDFYHGSSASAAGGITTIIDMPCTSIPPVTDLENFQNKLEHIKKKSIVDYGLFGGVSADSFDEHFPHNMTELAPYILGFKTYFTSGMKAFPRLTHWQFEQVLKQAIELRVPVLVHSEDFDYIDSATRWAKQMGNEPYHYYLSRPEITEILAVQNIVDILDNVMQTIHFPDDFKPVHIVHITTGNAVERITDKPITCESCPHYLAFDLEDFKKIGSPLKVTPVIKSPGNREKLWKYIIDGKIDFVASDHAPASYQEKHTGSIWTDYSGIPGTGTLLPFIFSEGYLSGRISLRRLVEIVSEMPAKRYGIYDRKGSIQLGKDADLVIIDPNAKWKVIGNNFLSKGKITPFEGMEFGGRIVKTILRGKVIYDYQNGIEIPAVFRNLITRD
ncbi:dihydroorotase [bacterium]|nr:MAG: dihydroorotase [bacterium]